MFIIAADVIFNIDSMEAVYVNEQGWLQLEHLGGTYSLSGIPSNALAQIAVAIAEGKRFVEFEDAHLEVVDE